MSTQFTVGDKIRWDRGKDIIEGEIIKKDKMKPFLAACAGVWIHGDLARQFGYGLIAEDAIKTIPYTLNKLKKWKIYWKKNR